jgi:hypothetical protein
MHGIDKQERLKALQQMHQQAMQQHAVVTAQVHGLAGQIQLLQEMIASEQNPPVPGLARTPLSLAVAGTVNGHDVASETAKVATPPGADDHRAPEVRE